MHLCQSHWNIPNCLPLKRTRAVPGIPQPLHNPMFRRVYNS